MGFGPDRVRFVGHAIGLELNEAPALARGVHTPLVDGAVIAVEPKLLYPGLGAVGIENSYVVRPGRPRAAHARGRRRRSGSSHDPAHRCRPVPPAVLRARSDRGRPRGLEPPRLGPARGRCALVVPRTLRASSAWRSSRTAQATSGRSSPRRVRPRSSVPDHMSTRCSTAARMTVRSGSSRRWSRSRPCAERRAGRAGRSRWAAWSTRRGRASTRPSSAAACSAASSRSTRCSRASIATGTRCASSPRHAESAAARSPRRRPGSSGSRSGSRCTSSRAWRSCDVPAAVGVATGLAPRERWRAGFEGSANHAGTTPMAGRRDALVAAARTVVAAERLARLEEGAVATVGRIEASPGASNVIPGSAELSLDVRARDGAALARVRDGIFAAAETDGIEVCWRRESLDPGSIFDEGLRAALTRRGKPRRMSRRPTSGRTRVMTRACWRGGCRQPCCSCGTRRGSRTIPTSMRRRRTAWQPARCSQERSSSWSPGTGERSPLCDRATRGTVAAWSFAACSSSSGCSHCSSQWAPQPRQPAMSGSWRASCRCR